LIIKAGTFSSDIDVRKMYLYQNYEKRIIRNGTSCRLL